MCIKQKIFNEYAVLDVEATGLNPEKDKIIEVAVCKVKDGNIIDEYYTFVNPEKNILPIITEITGITNDMVKEAETIDIVIPKLFNFIGQLPIVVHSSKMAMRIMGKYCEDNNIDLNNELIDVLPLCKKKFPKLRDYRTTTIYNFLENTDVELDRCIDYARAIHKVYEKIK